MLLTDVIFPWKQKESSGQIVRSDNSIIMAIGVSMEVVKRKMDLKNTFMYCVVYSADLNIDVSYFQMVFRNLCWKLYVLESLDEVKVSCVTCM